VRAAPLSIVSSALTGVGTVRDPDERGDEDEEAGRYGRDDRRYLHRDFVPELLGQGRAQATRGEEGDGQFIERGREREQERRHQTRAQNRKRDAAKGGPRTCAQTLRGEIETGVVVAQHGHHRDHDVGHGNRRMGKHQAE
jgi:hypothetical protein